MNELGQILMEVRIVDFPETKVAALEHHGPPQREYDTARRLIEWRLQNRLHPDRHRSYGIHYTDPRTTLPADHRVDFCISVDGDVPPNPQGVINKVIPGGRCAVARHLGSRANNAAAVYLYEVWFPKSGDVLRDFPIFFHYVNVGPQVLEHEMTTDVYLPLK
jgi:AraC family transcriptional regulator